MDEVVRLLVHTPTREQSGRRTGNRYRYQHFWTVDKLLELVMASEEDWMVACEDHEDVVVVRKEPSGARIYLYQVKSKLPLKKQTRTASWTIAALTNRSGTEPNQKPSILGTVLGTARTLGWGKVARLAVVSNAEFNVTPMGRKKRSKLRRTTLGSLGGKCYRTVTERLSEELDSNVTLKELQQFDLLTTKYGPDDYEPFIRGKLSSAMEEIHGRSVPNVGTLLRFLEIEVRRRSSREDEVSDASQFYEMRTITRSQFVRWCSDAMLQPVERTLAEWWPEAAADLSSRGIGPLAKKGLRASAAEVATSVVDRSVDGEKLEEVRRQVVRVVEQARDDDIRHLLERARQTVQVPDGLDPCLAEGMMLQVVYGEI